jgi:hypothetical protein
VLEVGILGPRGHCDDGFRVTVTWRPSLAPLPAPATGQGDSDRDAGPAISGFKMGKGAQKGKNPSQQVIGPLYAAVRLRHGMPGIRKFAHGVQHHESGQKANIFPSYPQGRNLWFPSAGSNRTAKPPHGSHDFWFWGDLQPRRCWARKRYLSRLIPFGPHMEEQQTEEPSTKMEAVALLLRLPI